MTKTEKKSLCRILDCQKLSPEVCGHVVRNERLPLRTVVQVLFFEQERRGSETSDPKLQHQAQASPSKQQATNISTDALNKLKCLRRDKQVIKEVDTGKCKTPFISEHHNTRKPAATEKQQ